MPAFDPDAEVSSLAYTIPSWISVIARTMRSTNLNMISSSAKSRLRGQLYTLRAQADTLLDNLKESAYE